MAEENAKFEWNAKQYSKFVKDRTLPSIDLAKAIDLPGAKAALDIGCGIGNSTAVLAKVFPGARVIGAYIWLEPLTDFSVLVKEEYPVRENGEIIFRFPRLFFTAKKK